MSTLNSPSGPQARSSAAAEASNVAEATEISHPTWVSGMPDRITSRAASGSPQKLNSASWVTLPGPEPALNNLVPINDKGPDKGLHLGQEGFYSFIFDGNSQMLDHFFVTSSLLASAKFDVVHLNVDFPRTFINTTASDHEPLLTSFSLD